MVLTYLFGNWVVMSILLLFFVFEPRIIAHEMILARCLIILYLETTNVRIRKFIEERKQG